MRKLISFLLISIIYISTYFILFGCIEPEEKISYDYIYGKYELKYWSYENENVNPNESRIIQDFEERVMYFSDEDYEEFKEIRDILGNTLECEDSKLFFNRESLEEELIIPYKTFGESPFSMYLITDSKLKDNSGLSIIYKRNKIENVNPKYYANVIEVEYYMGDRVNNDYLSLIFFYVRNSEI